MKVVTLEVGTSGSEEKFKVTKEVAETIGEAVAVYGEEIVYSIFMSKLSQNIQGVCRNQEDEAAAQSVATKYVPGVAKKRKSSEMTQAIALLKDKLPEEVAAILEQLKGV